MKAEFEIREYSVGLTELNAALMAVVEMLGHAVALIATDARVVHLNGAARRLVQQQDCVRLIDGAIHFRKAAAQHSLMAFLDGCQRPRQIQSTVDSIAFSIERPDGTQALRVFVAALQLSGYVPGEDCPTHVVLVYDRDAVRTIPTAILMSAYGLTPTEATLVARMFEGRRLADAAESLQISMNTAKTHLKRVFTKCGVSSQAELLRLLSLGPWIA